MFIPIWTIESTGIVLIFHFFIHKLIDFTRYHRNIFRYESPIFLLLLPTCYYPGILVVIIVVACISKLRPHSHVAVFQFQGLFTFVFKVSKELRLHQQVPISVYNKLASPDEKDEDKYANVECCESSSPSLALLPAFELDIIAKHRSKHVHGFNETLLIFLSSLLLLFFLFLLFHFELNFSIILL